MQRTSARFEASCRELSARSLCESWAPSRGAPHRGWFLLM